MPSWLQTIISWFMHLFHKPNDPVCPPEDPVLNPETNPEKPHMKKALLVGINKYPMAPLRGCVNDVLLMYKIITEHFDFKSENVDVLTDEECTKANILSHLRKLVKNVGPGDYIYFHYSGHGSQMVINDLTNNDESDGMDEILCPVNLGYNFENPIRDHELGAFFKTLPAGVKVLIVLDCCHSGTGLRNSWNSIKNTDGLDADIWVNRFLPPPPSNILSDSRVSIDDALNFVVPSIVNKNGFMHDTAKQGNAILLSGCQDNQTSADAKFGLKFFGAMTRVLANKLINSKYDITYKELIEQINKDMNKYKFTQNPQLEAKAGLFTKKFLK